MGRRLFRMLIRLHLTPHPRPSNAIETAATAAGGGLSEFTVRTRDSIAAGVPVRHIHLNRVQWRESWRTGSNELEWQPKLWKYWLTPRCRSGWGHDCYRSVATLDGQREMIRQGLLAAFCCGVLTVAGLRAYAENIAGTADISASNNNNKTQLDYLRDGNPSPPWNSFVTAQQGIPVRVQFDWQKTVHVDTVLVTLKSVGTDRNTITVEVDGPWRKGPATLVIDRVVKNGENSFLYL